MNVPTRPAVEAEAGAAARLPDARRLDREVFTIEPQQIEQKGGRAGSAAGSRGRGGQGAGGSAAGRSKFATATFPGWGGPWAAGEPGGPNRRRAPGLPDRKHVQAGPGVGQTRRSRHTNRNAPWGEPPRLETRPGSAPTTRNTTRDHPHD